VYNDLIFNKEYIDAVLVKIQLYSVISVNKFCSSGGFMGNNLGMAHINTKYQKKYFSIESTADTTQSLSKEANFLKWFVGFSDAESNFSINPLLKKDKVTIASFSFMFKISLHKDDEGVLRYINNKLAIGNVRLYKNECIFNVTDREGIKLLISIFDKYNLNTTKYLDYLDFKKAFNLYINTPPSFEGRGAINKNSSAELVKNIVIELKNKMNTNRFNFDRPENSPIKITKS
jgi:hypothetical protein